MLLSQDLSQRIDGGFVNWGHAADVGVEVYLECNASSDAKEDAVERYRRALVESNCTDVLAQEFEYAISLALADGDLVFEEMCKLYALCETTVALSRLGLSCDAGLTAALPRALRVRIGRQRGVANAAAETTRRGWSKDFWCYDPLLGAAQAVSRVWIERAEARLSGIFPEEYVSAMMLRNGGVLEVDKSVWEVCPIWDRSNTREPEKAPRDVLSETADAEEDISFPIGGVVIGRAYRERLLLLRAEGGGEIGQDVFAWSPGETTLEPVGRVRDLFERRYP